VRKLSIVILLMAIKKYIKKSRIYRKVVKPYVNKKKGRSNRMKLYSEVNQIKKMINAEKKTADLSVNGAGVAQLVNGADGIFVSNITPTISQGSGYQERTGRSIKLSGAYLRGKFVAQTNTINKVKYNMLVVTTKGKPQTTSEIAAGMFNTDTLSTVRDYFAPRNPDSYTDYRIIASRNYTLYPDSISGQTGIVDFIMPLKLTHHIRYSLNTTTIEEGQLYIIIRGDSGDSGTPLTGAFFNLSLRLNYYDN
jgi:hypothetical protein